MMMMRVEIVQRETARRELGHVRLLEPMPEPEHDLDPFALQWVVL